MFVWVFLKESDRPFQSSFLSYLALLFLSLFRWTPHPLCAVRNYLAIAAIKKLPGAPSPESGPPLVSPVQHRLLVRGRGGSMQPPVGSAQLSCSPRPP